MKLLPLFVTYFIKNLVKTVRNALELQKLLKQITLKGSGMS